MGVLHILLFLFCCFLFVSSQGTDQAKAAYRSYITKFWSNQSHFLEDTYPSNGKLTQYWVAAEGLQTSADYAGFLKDNSYSYTVSEFFTTQQKAGWLRNWYDDEAWMANALISAYEFFGKNEYLAAAQDLFRDMQGAWDTSCCENLYGGNWWDKSHTQKATASNAGPVIVGARLYQHTKDNSILQWCEKVYWFWADHMVNNQTGQVCDHFDNHGVKLWWKFTYNEGLMIGAGVEMFKATNDNKYLEVAKLNANFMITNEIVGNSILYDGTDSGCSGDCTQFKGPAFRYLVELYLVVKDSRYLKVLQNNANSIWNVARNPGSDLFGVDWATSYSDPKTTYQSQQNAATMALIHNVRL